MNTANIALRAPLSRRTFLRGAGAMLALPFLESMMTRRCAAEPASPRRFVGMMTNQGILPEFFFPKTGGKEYESTPYLDLLKERREDMTVFSGVSFPGVDGGHASEQSFLTGAPGASRGSFKNSVSLDQAIADAVGPATRFPSLVLGLGEGLSLSWTRSGAMIPTLRSPLKLYQKLFVEDTPADKAASVRRLQQDRSLLDGLCEQYRKLQQSVSVSDRNRLEQFATGVRDAEKRLAAAQGWMNVPKPKVAAKQPSEISDGNDLPKNTRSMYDLIRLALETDSTRVITFCACVTSIVPDTIPGVKTQVHTLSHHGQQPATVAELRLIEEAQFRELAQLLNGLHETKENGSTLLDRTSVLYGTNMGSANAHSTDNLPALLAGGGFKHGQHLAFDRKKNYPLSNLYVSLLQRMGVEADKFSSGTGTLRGLEMA
ncbi:MAG: DUF1552 domain-containing protein [Planctomycetota bacterium]